MNFIVCRVCLNKGMQRWTSYRKRFEWAKEEPCFAFGYDEQKSGLVERVYIFFLFNFVMLNN